MKPKLLASSVLCFCVSGLVPLAARAQAAPSASAPAPSAPADKAAPAAPDSAAPAPGAAAPEAAPAAAAPSAAAMEEAKQRFDRGLDLYTEGEYPLALIEFRRAYELVPNYRVLYNIGQVSIQLGQYANARRALEEYVQKGGEAIPADRRAAVSKDLSMLEQRTAFVEITANVPGSDVLVDDVAIGKTPLGGALLVDAGIHRVIVRHPGYLQRNDQVTLAGGDRQSLALTLELEPPEKSTIVVREREVESNSTLVIGGWVTTGALATAAIVTGILGAGKADDLKKLRTANPSDYSDLGAKLDDTKSSARTLLLVSDVCSGAAVVVGGLSLWFTLNPLKSSSEAPVAESDSARALQLGYEANQVKLRGSF
ncbi:MAG TPA: PEGA domain-containing protein [Polyangiaceae bacterium]|nr:PEGA domain-containing protein [Polyangiaceae bacterium]